MPIPLLLLAGGAAIAAAARGAAWLAERQVDEINKTMWEIEAQARQLNDTFRDQRQYWKTEWDRHLSFHHERLKGFMASNEISSADLDGWEPEPWLLDRMGELSVGHPLLITPNFDPPASQNMQAGMRAYAQGQSMSQTSPRMASAMQNLGFATAAGSYVSQQTKIVGDSQKYVAAARVYTETLRKAIDGFAARFQSETEIDARNVGRVAQLVQDLLDNDRQRVDPRSVVFVFQQLIGYLNGLVKKYA